MHTSVVTLQWIFKFVISQHAKVMVDGDLCCIFTARVESFHVNPRFHPTDVDRNLGLTRKLPTAVTVIYPV